MAHQTSWIHLHQWPRWKVLLLIPGVQQEQLKLLKCLTHTPIGKSMKHMKNKVHTMHIKCLAQQVQAHILSCNAVCFRLCSMSQFHNSQFKQIVLLCFARHSPTAIKNMTDRNGPGLVILPMWWAHFHQEEHQKASESQGVRSHQEQLKWLKCLTRAPTGKS